MVFEGRWILAPKVSVFREHPFDSPSPSLIVIRFTSVFSFLLLEFISLLLHKHYSSPNFFSHHNLRTVFYRMGASSNLVRLSGD